MTTEFRSLPDLALRSSGGSVVYANDETFAPRENLIEAGPARLHESFGPKGKVYDGWETRRRREPGHDVAIVRLGIAGVVRGVVIDTSWFTGNFPPAASVEAACVSGHPSVTQLRDRTEWTTILARSLLDGDGENEFAVDSEQRWTHVRLSIYPDGGVARFRVFGVGLPDPRVLDAMGVFDLAALEFGGLVVGCSNMFYGSPHNLIAPGLSRSMAEGWETERRRDDGNDWVRMQLAGAGTVALAELDTSYFLGNAPGWASLTGYRDGAAGAGVELVARTKLQPDTRHRFVLTGQTPVTHVRLDVFPDGGMSRLRLLGSLAPHGRERVGLSWFNAVSPSTATQALTDYEVPRADAVELVARRPIDGTEELTGGIRRLLWGR